MKKVEMYDLIKMHKPQNETFTIDRMLADHGQCSGCLPTILIQTPIEQIWCTVKTRIAAKNVHLTCEMNSNWHSRILSL
jgi:hypothetical protein